MPIRAVPIRVVMSSNGVEIDAKGRTYVAMQGSECL